MLLLSPDWTVTHTFRYGGVSYVLATDEAMAEQGLAYGVDDLAEQADYGASAGGSQRRNDPNGAAGASEPLGRWKRSVPYASRG